MLYNFRIIGFTELVCTDDKDKRFDVDLHQSPGHAVTPSKPGEPGGPASTAETLTPTQNVGLPHLFQNTQVP